MHQPIMFGRYTRFKTPATARQNLPTPAEHPIQIQYKIQGNSIEVPLESVEMTLESLNKNPLESHLY